MTTASIRFSAQRTSAQRISVQSVPWRERLSTGGAAAASIMGIIIAIGIAVLGLLVVPLAAAVVFGPALLALI